MKIFLIALTLLGFSQVVNAECSSSDSLAKIIAYKPVKGQYFEMLEQTVSDSGLKLPIYADLIEEFGEKYFGDMDVHGGYSKSLEENFSCSEMDQIYEFANSRLGREFFPVYMEAIVDGGLDSVSMAEFYMDEFKKRMEERNELIISHLVEIKEMPSPRNTGIVVASTNLPKGTIIVKDNLQVRQLPSKYISSYFVLPKDHERLVGKITSQDIRKGDPVILNLLESE